MLSVSHLRRLPVLVALLSLAALPWCAAQEAPREVQLPAAGAAPEDRKALVIGAGAYQALPAADAALNDARDFAEFLQRRLGFPERNVTLMTDLGAGRLKPTDLNVLAAEEDLVRDVDANSVVVLFVSGHGVRDRQTHEDHFLPLDAPAAESRNGASLTGLLRRLSEKRPKAVLAFFDLSRKFRGAGYEAGLEPLPRTTLFYASHAGENSFDGLPEDFTRGVFTYYLLRALGGEAPAAEEPDGTVSVESLRGYLQREARRYVMPRYNATQSPDGLSPAPSALVKLAAARPAAPPPAPLAAPTGLKAAPGPGQVVLTWTDASADETGFTIERRMDTGSFVPLAMVGADTTRYEDRDLKAGSAYVYRVRATRPGADSPFSNEVTIVLPPTGSPAGEGDLVVAKDGDPSHLPTIGEALKRAQPGTRILVRPGVYRESLLIDKPKVEIIGTEQAEDTIISGPEAADAVVVRAEGVRLERLTVRGNAGGGIRNMKQHAVNVAAGDVTLERCIVTSDSMAGVYVPRRSRALLLRSRVLDCRGCGVVVMNNGDVTLDESNVVNSTYTGVLVTGFANLIARGCRINRNGRSGFRLHPRTGELEVLEDTRSAGIQFRFKSNGSVQDCELRENGEAGIDDESDGKVERENNRS